MVKLLVFALILQICLSVSASEDRALQTLLQMNITEKLDMLHGYDGTYIGNILGNSRLGIPALKMHDGPQGFRTTQTTGPQGSTTAWPSSLTISASWSTELAYKWAAAMAKEFKGKGANMQLGPGIGFARVPTGGRNFEYLCGEDPVLGSQIVKPVVKGIQDQGIIANAKHWVNNEIETNRKSVSADVSERTRFEIYYPPFEAAIEAGVLSVMCSYNRINDVSSCENSDTMNHLKNTMNFTGWVLSDWLATYSTLPSMEAGLDQEMPVGLYYNPSVLTKYINTGKINETRIDESVYRILSSMYKIGLFDTDEAARTTGNPNANVTSLEHNELARELSSNSIVLLQNKGNVLPLNPTAGGSVNAKCIAVIGDNSTIGGGGSGKVTPYYTITPAQGIINALNDKGITDVSVLYSSGTDITQATQLAASCDTAVVIVATSSSEASDRPSLALGGNQDELVSAVAAVNANTIVGVVTPGAVLMPWSAQVAAIVVLFMPGQEYGNALADVLFGTVNPSARLPVTMPNKDNEIAFTDAQFPGVGSPPDATYSEELLVGYRWYLANDVTPLFPFGHGLSYTEFSYEKMSTSKSSSTSSCGYITVSTIITNTGSVAGRETVQLYLEYPTEAKEPPRQLRGFVKTPILEPQSSAQVDFCLSERDFSIWDESIHAWTVLAGDGGYTYKLFLAASVADIRLQTSLTL